MIDNKSISSFEPEKPSASRYNILIGIFLAMTTVGMAITAFGIFFKPVSADFGWTRAETAGAFSLSTMISGVVGLIAGRLGDRFSPRLIILICGVVVSVAYLLLSQMTGLWQLYFYFGILVGAGLANIVPASSLVARWYKKQRGLMTGVALSGAAFCSLFAPYLATWLIARYNWHISYFVIGILTLVILAIAAFFLYRTGKERPVPVEKTSRLESQGTVKGTSFQEAIRSWPFWCLASIYLCFHFALTVVAVHIVAHATDIGISPFSAAFIVTLSNGANIIGSFTLGGINDRIGGRKSLVLGMSVLTASFILLLVANRFWMLCLFAGIFGVAWGGTSIIRSIMVAELFGMRAHGALVGAILLIALMGGTVSPLLAGYIFDATGQYQLAFYLMLGLSLIGTMLSIFLWHRFHPNPHLR